MDIKKVKDVIELMKENDLVEIELVDGESKIHLKRPQAGMTLMPQMPMQMPMGGGVAPAVPAADSGLLDIKAPIVGTFYQASSPDAAPYVKSGTKVETDTVVCIIEAMKVLNEVKAETGGTIVEVCCKDGQSVEFGQVLFRVRP